MVDPSHQCFSTPDGTHTETYALKRRPFDSELEPSVAIRRAWYVPLLTGDGALLMPLDACMRSFEKR